MPGDSVIVWLLGPLLMAAGGLLLFWIVRRQSDLQPSGFAAWSGLTLGLFLLLGGGGGTLLVLTGESNPRGDPAGGTVIDRAAPDLRFRSVETGQWHELSEYRGQVVLLNLWATWCPPCLDELPELNRFRREYGPEGVEVITISDERPGTIRRFEREQFEIETVNGYLPGDLEWPTPYDRVLRSRPYSFVVGPDGSIRNMWAGARDFGFFVRAVRPHLPAPSRTPTGSDSR